ncbi:hypothetical protein DIPPA_16948 [Diplonema papillatum]|nr:hypothetical protein DIPPA_16948 [Diplonema papillatum]
MPLAIKVAQVKAVGKAAFGIAPEEQLLVFKSLDHEIPIPVPLDSDLEPLSYYGILGGKGIIEVSKKAG